MNWPPQRPFWECSEFSELSLSNGSQSALKHDGTFVIGAWTATVLIGAEPCMVQPTIRVKRTLGKKKAVINPRTPKLNVD